MRGISVLQTSPAKTMKTIAKLFGSTERTVYRYLDLLKAVGFKVEKTDGPPGKREMLRARKMS